MLLDPMSDELVVAVDESAFKRAMSYFASGVTVVTTEHAGHWFGLTVSAFCSVSLRPPLVLVCIEKSVRAHDAIPRRSALPSTFCEKTRKRSPAALPAGWRTSSRDCRPAPDC
jgi:hypothetical protein